MAYAVGIAAADRGALGVAAAQLLVVQALVLGAAAARWPRARAACALAAALGAGAHALAARCADAVWTAAPTSLEVTVEARVAAVETRGGSAWVTLERVVRADAGAEPLPRRARVSVDAPSPRSPAPAPAGALPPPPGVLRDAVPGDRVRARLRLRPVTARSNPGGADPASRLRRAGVGAVGSAAHPLLAVRVERGPVGRVRARFAARRSAAAARLARDGAPLAAALALGVRDGIAPESEEALRASGLTHLLSVSGLHLAMLGGLAFAGARRALLRATPLAAADPRRAALAAAWLAAVAYAALTGFAVPVRRSLVFASVVALGVALRRRVRTSHLLAAAALAVLAMEPAALFDAGAQLSFAGAGALLLARRAPRGEEAAAGASGASGRACARARAAARFARSGLRASAAALAATAPLVALHFGRVAPGALLANLIAVPLTGALLLPASLAAALAALAAPHAPAATWLPAAAVRAGAFLLEAVARAATLGPAADRAAAASPLALAGGALAALAALRARGTAARVALAALGHLALAAVPAPRLVPGSPRAVFLDVGHADAVLVQGRRAALLVDGGLAQEGGLDLGRTVVLPSLAALGVARLDLVAASHADLDHAGGLAAVLERTEVARLWLPRGVSGEPALARLAAIANRRGARVEERGRGDPPTEVGDLRVETLWPPGEPGALGENDRSLVLRVEVAGTRLLLPGDVEAAAESALDAEGIDLAAHVLKLPHHGSRTSSTDALLRRVGAQVAVASAPCLGRFGMPHADVRARVRAAGASLWWTGRDGAVVVGLARPIVVRGLAPPRPRGERWRCGG